MELNSGNLGSQCEAVIAVLQGLMSSEGGTSAGGVTGGVTDLELAKICQQIHMSVTGCNNSLPQYSHVSHSWTDSVRSHGTGQTYGSSPLTAHTHLQTSSVGLQSLSLSDL